MAAQGVEMPPELAKGIAERQAQRKQRVKDKLGFDVDFSEVTGEHAEKIKNSAMVKDLDKIMDGEWDGKAHWTMENC